MYFRTPVLLPLLPTILLLPVGGFQLVEGQSAGSTTLQQQIDELKAAQQRLSNEVEQLKMLIQEKNRRADYPTRPSRPSVVTLGVEGEVFRGSPNAKIAVIEYSDFDCSFCAK